MAPTKPKPGGPPKTPSKRLGGKGLPVTPSNKGSSTKNTPSTIKRSVTKKTPSKTPSKSASKALVNSADEDDETDELPETPEKPWRQRKRGEATTSREKGVLYATELHSIRATPPKHLVKGEDLVQRSIEVDEDEIMENMHPESARLAAEVHRQMSEQGEGYTFASYAMSQANNEEDGDDEYDEEGMVEAGLASAKKKKPAATKGGKSGKPTEIKEYEEKYWMNAYGQLIRIDPDNPEEPTACNNMARTKKKAHGPVDPNGRFIGRHLVNWHRPRMMEKLVLNIQFECHKAGIQLPWDKIVHRLNPGSSGPAATQMLNKMRDILICEGHLIPPAMGKRTMKVDPMVRGYVRDLTKQDPRAARILYWTEPYENAKYSLDWGTTLGSGQYRKLLKNPKVEEDSDDVEKPRLFQLPSSNANPRQRIPTGGGDIRRAKPTPRKSRAKIVSSDEEDEDEIEIKPEELDPDDDWSPEAGKMKKTKGGRRKVAVRTRITRLTESESEGESVHHSSSSGSPTPSYIVKLPIRVPESVGNTNRRQRAVARNTLGSEDEKDDAMNDHAMKMEEDAEHEVDSDGNEDFESGAGGDREMDSTTMSSGNNSQAYSGVYSSQAPMYRGALPNPGRAPPAMGQLVGSVSRVSMQPNMYTAPAPGMYQGQSNHHMNYMSQTDFYGNSVTMQQPFGGSSSSNYAQSAMIDRMIAQTALNSAPNVNFEYQPQHSQYVHAKNDVFGRGGTPMDDEE